MTNPVLDAKRWKDFLEDRLPAGEARDLAARLRGGCLESEDFLLDLPGDPVDAIHGMDDDLRGDDAILDEAEMSAAYRAVMDRVERAGSKKAPHSRPWHEALPFSIQSVSLAKRRYRGNDAFRKRIGLIAGGMLTVAFSLMFSPVKEMQERRRAAELSGVKGAVPSDGAIPEVALSFAVARAGKVIRSGRPGIEVSSDVDLLFRFRVTGGPVHLYLLRVQGANPQLVWPPAGAPSRRVQGEADLTVDGVVQGVSMAGLSGNVHFVAVASARPLDNPAQGPWPEAVTDTVMVRVEAAAR